MESGYKLVDVTELNITCNTLQNEVLMRYLSNPGNLDNIRMLIKGLFTMLKQLPGGSDVMMAECQLPWKHVGCRCVAPTITEECYVESHQKL